MSRVPVTPLMVALLLLLTTTSAHAAPRPPDEPAQKFTQEELGIELGPQAPDGASEWLRQQIRDEIY
ncbi:MAG: hypothetical protein DSY88_10710, partial [Candidatus Poseidoniales archaeon]